jgi:DNA primase
MVEILLGSERRVAPQVDWPRIDATTQEIAAQIAQDNPEAMRDAAT